MTVSAISGAVRQKSAVSVNAKSRTTSHSRLRSPSRWSAPLEEPTAGFSPITKYLRTLPCAMSATVVMCEWSPLTAGNQLKRQSFSSDAAPPNQAFIRETK